jgi:hypothetical protein
MTTFTTPASVSGVAQEGQLLTALGEVDDPMATITYQWQENISGTWTDIPGATSQTYTVIEADEGNALRVVETATDGGGWMFGLQKRIVYSIPEASIASITPSKMHPQRGVPAPSAWNNPVAQSPVDDLDGAVDFSVRHSEIV